MARDINTDNVLRIMAALTEANASDARGLSIPELANSTGLTRYVIGRILDRPEYGFDTARGRSDTGAVTYYHSVAKMTATVYNDTTGKIQPLQFEDEDKITLLVQNLLSALHIVDPANQLVAEFNREQKEDKSKDYFDWLLSEEQMKWLARKAKSEKRFQGKYIIQNNLDNLAVYAYNGPKYLTRMVEEVKDGEAAIKFGMYCILTGFIEAAWKDNTVGEDVMHLTPDEN